MNSKSTARDDTNKSFAPGIISGGAYLPSREERRSQCTPINVATIQSLDLRAKKGRIFYGPGGVEVSAADPELVKIEQEER